MRLVGNHLVLVLVAFFLLFAGHLTLSSHPCYIGTEEYNIVLEQKDSVLCERVSANLFEKIRIVHKEEVCLRNLKQSPYWEISEYGQKQKSIFKQMRTDIIKQIPVPTLSKSLEYKFNPIICELTIAPHEGVVKKVSFLINHEISSDFTDEDILELERIILNTQFIPDSSISGDVLVCNYAIGRKAIREYLDSKK